MPGKLSKLAIKEEIFKVLQQIAPDAALDEVAPNDDLREVSDIGPSGFSNLLVRLRKDLKVDIPESDRETVSTLTELVRYLSERLK
jgi:hypothetical protein